MKKMVCVFSLLLAGLMMFLVGCESDSTPDDITFRNNSSYQLTVTVRNTASNTDVQLELTPNGGEAKYMKVLIEPLTYTYSPTANVSDRRDGDVVIFENQVQFLK